MCILVPEPVATGGEASFNTLLEALVPRNRMSIQFLYGSAFFKSNLIYLFMAVLGLRCCMDATLVGVRLGFSLLWLLLLWSTGSRVLGLPKLQLTGSKAQFQ